MSNLYFHGQGEIVTGTATIDPASIADGATLDIDVTVTGVTTSDILLSLQPPEDLLANLAQVGVWISAANTITTRLLNESGGALDQASKVWKYAYLKTTD